MKYYYGLPDMEAYYNTDIEEVIEENEGDYTEPYVVFEFKAGPESGLKWCREYGEPIEECDCCNKYIARNGKNGICKHNYWCVYETGRQFLVDPKTGKYKKIKSRSSK